MLLLFQTYLDITLLRKGPQDLPRSGLLLAFTAVALAALELLWLQVAELAAARFVLVELAAVALELAAVAAMLLARNHGARVLQTFTALLGAQAVLTLVNLVPAAFYVEGTVSDGVALAQLAILAWALLVTGHVLASALDAPRSVGVLIAIAIFIAQIALLQRFLPT